MTVAESVDLAVKVIDHLNRWPLITLLIAYMVWRKLKVPVSAAISRLRLVESPWVKLDTALPAQSATGPAAAAALASLGPSPDPTGTETAESGLAAAAQPSTPAPPAPTAPRAIATEEEAHAAAPSLPWDPAQIARVVQMSIHHDVDEGEARMVQKMIENHPGQAFAEMKRLLSLFYFERIYGSMYGTQLLLLAALNLAASGFMPEDQVKALYDEHVKRAMSVQVRPATFEEFMNYLVGNGLITRPAPGLGAGKSALTSPFVQHFTSTYPSAWGLRPY